MQLTMTVLRCPDCGGSRNPQRVRRRVFRWPRDLAWTGSCRTPSGCCRSGTSPWRFAAAAGNSPIPPPTARSSIVKSDAIGAGDMRSLRDGDRLRLGAYEIEVRLTEEAVAHAGGSAGGSPFDDPFGMDPFGSARPECATRSTNRIIRASRICPRAQLPHDFDPLMPDRHETPFRGPTQADHSPAMQDAFHVSAPGRGRCRCTRAG